ncbi:hypothetical protein GWK47_025739 [Chionoecetes opilio]|uniref:Uncharacterized protein n=1 Tax=Chionoecetes opilio TaxID=41210 RepID=A0A8J8WD37_CHIOP|nr:hypothetical protein GWK47_025739 [Chionoecetes opilio]
MVQLTIIGWAVRFRENFPEGPGAFPPGPWMAKVIYTLDHPPFPGEFASPNTRRGSDRFTRLFGHKSTWNRGCPPTARSARQRPRPPLNPAAQRKGDGGGIGKVMARPCGTLPGARASLFDEATVGGEGARAAHAAGLGEKKPPLPRRRRLDEWGQPPWVVCDDQLGPLTAPRGRSRFLNVDPADGGRGRLTRSSGAALRVVKTFWRGARPPSAFAAPSRAREQRSTFCRWERPRGFYPCAK